MDLNKLSPPKWDPFECEANLSDDEWQAQWAKQWTAAEKSQILLNEGEERQSLQLLWEAEKNKKNITLPFEGTSCCEVRLDRPTNLQG